MYPVLYETGFANQPTATDRNDGLKLKNLYITAAVRCAPPDNKPLPEKVRPAPPSPPQPIPGAEPKPAPRPELRPAPGFSKG
jgi:hypothetical protein